MHEKETIRTSGSSFVVNRTDGHFCEAKVLQGINKDLDVEAQRLVNAMPNWI